MQTNLANTSYRDRLSQLEHFTATGAKLMELGKADALPGRVGGPDCVSGVPFVHSHERIWRESKSLSTH